MNIAIILAGGSGTRMGLDIPKQFVEIENKPVLLYTLQVFQNNCKIDAIEIVFASERENETRKIVNNNNITKCKWYVKGGNTAQESIRNGIFNLKNIAKNDDIVIIHDGVRPLIDDAMIIDNIEKCEKYGNAICSNPCYEQMVIKDDDYSSTKYIPRDSLMKAGTPQSFKYKLAYEKFEEAFAKNIGISDSFYANNLMSDLGVKLYFSKGSNKNIKLTTKEDLSLFKAYLKVNKND